VKVFPSSGRGFWNVQTDIMSLCVEKTTTAVTGIEANTMFKAAPWSLLKTNIPLRKMANIPNMVNMTTRRMIDKECFMRLNVLQFRRSAMQIEISSANVGSNVKATTAAETFPNVPLLRWQYIPLPMASTMFVLRIPITHEAKTIANKMAYGRIKSPIVKSRSFLIFLAKRVCTLNQICAINPNVVAAVKEGIP